MAGSALYLAVLPFEGEVGAVVIEAWHTPGLGGWVAVLTGVFFEICLMGIVVAIKALLRFYRDKPPVEVTLAAVDIFVRKLEHVVGLGAIGMIEDRGWNGQGLPLSLIVAAVARAEQLSVAVGSAVGIVVTAFAVGAQARPLPLLGVAI